MDFYEGARRIEVEKRLDPVATKVGDAVGKLVPTGPVKDVLSGKWLGHTLHPVLTDGPIGAWVWASVLDATGGRRSEDGARALVGWGILAALPTAATGLSDYADTFGPERRVGIAHAGLNAVALTLYGASWAARRRGSTGAGKALALAGLGVASIGAYLGGHLSLDMGVGVDHTAYEAGPRRWTAVADESELAEDEPRKVRADGMDVMVVRHRGRIRALGHRCTHAGGPLSEGEIGDGTVTCPWHGSIFSLDDGRVRRGPARAPEPAFETRVVDGKVEVRQVS
jgi:nitrite reductase/ring-hydroxylating ferredoxin subunit